MDLETTALRHELRQPGMSPLLAIATAITACVTTAVAVRSEEPAQTAAATIVSGRVLHATSGTPVAGARVSAGDQTTETDAGGHFQLRLSVGHWTIAAEADGFTPGRSDAAMSTRPAADVEIRLVPARRFREQIDVVTDADATLTAPATVPVRPAQIVSVAGGAENVFRVLQTLPGVTGTDDFSSRLSVRGGGPDQNLTIMDGVEVHNPYRLFGLTSAFNPETVERFELTAGAFSASYGDRLSSLLVIDTRAGSNRSWLTGSAALSVTDTNAIVEGRLPGGRGSWLLSGRRTYYDIIAERFTDSDLPSFGDLQGKLVWQLGRGRTLSLFSLTSRERTDASFDLEAEAAKGALFTRTRNDLLTATLNLPLGRRGWARTIGALYTNTDVTDFGGTFRDETRRSNAPDVSGFATTDLAVAWSGSVRDRSVRQELGIALGRGHSVETGFELHRLRTSIAFTVAGGRNETEANGSSLQGGASLPDAFDSARGDTRLGAWLLDRWQLGSRWTLEGGLRADRSTINGRSYASPRLAMTYAWTPALRVRAAFGVHRQSPGYEKLIQSDYFMDLSGDGRLPLASERARHLLLSLERDLGKGLLARVEGYYKGFDGLVIGRLETPAETASRLARYDFPDALASSLPTHAWITRFPTNDGRGHAWGADIYAARRATSPTTRLTGWASYTLGFAERSGYGLTYPFDYDRRHAVSVVANLRLSSRFDVALTGRVASGFPYTPVLGLRVASAADAADADGDGNREELVPARDPGGRLVYTPDLGDLTNMNAARMPYYARLDTRVTYAPGWGRGRVKLYLDAINVLNRKNAGMIETTLEYDPSSDRPRLVSKPQASLPFLPSFGVHVNFATPRWTSKPRTPKSDCADAGRPCPPGGTRTRSFAIGLRPIGSQGPGLDLAYSLSRRLGVRLGFAIPSTYSSKEETDGTTYDVRLQLGAQLALLDWHPFAGRFRLSGGLCTSRHRFDLRAQDAAEYQVGGVTYAGAEIGTLHGTAGVRRVAPYVGLGWGQPARRSGRFGLVFDLGGVIEGAPRVALRATGPLALDATFQQSLAREAATLADRLRGWRVFPVVAVSLSYRLR
jgi:outer membrane cobalamin receptor